MKKKSYLKDLCGILSRRLLPIVALLALCSETLSAQTPKSEAAASISLSVKERSVEAVLEQLRSQYGYSFVYKAQELNTILLPQIRTGA